MKKSNLNSILILIDHDGTLCDTNKNSYSSLKFANHSALESIGLENTINSFKWEEIFNNTAGTTEKNLVKVLAYTQNIPLNKYELFEKRFYEARASWYKNMNSYGEFTDDTYYPDVEHLILSLTGNKSVCFGLVTGNPRAVMGQRLSKHLCQSFSNKKKELRGAFGDEALTRKELLELAIDRHIQENRNFKITRDSNHFINNVVYIADGESDFYAGIMSEIKTIWMPSKKIQDISDIKNRKYMQIIDKYLAGNYLLTNKIDLNETLKFIGLL